MDFQENFSAICISLFVAGAIVGVVALILRKTASQAKADVEAFMRREKQIQMMELLIRNATNSKGQVIALVYAANNGFMDKKEAQRLLAGIDHSVFHGRPLPKIH